MLARIICVILFLTCFVNGFCQNKLDMFTIRSTDTFNYSVVFESEEFLSIDSIRGLICYIIGNYACDKKTRIVFLFNRGVETVLNMKDLNIHNQNKTDRTVNNIISSSVVADYYHHKHTFIYYIESNKGRFKVKCQGEGRMNVTR